MSETIGPKYLTCFACEGKGFLLNGHGTGDQGGGWADTCPECEGSCVAINDLTTDTRFSVTFKGLQHLPAAVHQAADLNTMKVIDVEAAQRLRGHDRSLTFCDAIRLVSKMTLKQRVQQLGRRSFARQQP